MTNNNNNLYNYIPQNEISKEENSFGVSSSVEYERKKYTWEQFRNTSVESVEDTETDNVTEEEYIDKSPGLSPQEPNIESNNNSANASEDKMCRICFAGSEEESNLGRL